MKKFFAILLIILAAGVAVFLYQKSNSRTNLPASQTYQDLSHNPPPKGALPPTINLAVPFTSQAPKMNWDADHEEFCEEAASLMAAAYIQNFTLSNPDETDQKLFAIKDFEMSQFGYFKDTTAVETSQILTKYFGIANVHLVNNPTLNQIKQALAAGKVIIEPAAGRQLGNPNFTGAGPLYHMVLLKGYTSDGKIITNDPGTRKGADYIYETNVLLDAMHDWNGGDVDNGQKIIIVVG